MATLTSNLDKIPLPKNTVAVAREDGRIYIVDFTEFPNLDDPTAIDWDLSVSKLIIAKIQQTRTRLGTLEEVEFENVVHTEQVPAGADGDLEIVIFGTLDGKNPALEVKPKVDIDEGGYVHANCRVTAKNFAIQLRGTYNVNTVQVTIHQNGRR